MELMINEDNIRNAKYNGVGGIDCEVNHPDLGWIPFTASPDDIESHGPEIYQCCLGMNPEPYVPIPTTVNQVKSEAQRRIFEIAPEWKQRNMIHREIMLSQKSTLTNEEQTEWDEINTVWQQINAIRDRSNELEEMQPIPLNIGDDEHW